MWTIIFLAIVFWIMYNLITKFILPVYKTTKRMQDQFRAMREQQNTQQNQPPSPKVQQDKPKEKTGEYIEFEEIK